MGPARPAIFARFGDTFIVRTGTFSASSQTSVAKKGFPNYANGTGKTHLAPHDTNPDDNVVSLLAIDMMGRRREGDDGVP